MTVTEGEVVALVGPNGAGKTSTIKAISGLVRPVSGEIAFCGEGIIGETPEALVARGIACVPEGRHIFGTLTVAENLQLGATVREDQDGVEADLEELLAQFPVLESTYSTYANRLSGGEQQQLAIARALLGKPRLLLLDEPSLGLAPLMIDLVFEILARLRASGVTILLVEQAAARAVAFADRSYLLKSGAVSVEGSRDDFAKRIDLGRAYLTGAIAAP
jgi:branched-chain amino acid transport system ATP-binding protein